MGQKRLRSHIFVRFIWSPQWLRLKFATLFASKCHSNTTTRKERIQEANELPAHCQGLDHIHAKQACQSCVTPFPHPYHSSATTIVPAGDFNDELDPFQGSHNYPSLECKFWSCHHRLQPLSLTHEFISTSWFYALRQMGCIEVSWGADNTNDSFSTCMFSSSNDGGTVDFTTRSSPSRPQKYTNFFSIKKSEQVPASVCALSSRNEVPRHQ